MTGVCIGWNPQICPKPRKKQRNPPSFNEKIKERNAEQSVWLSRCQEFLRFKKTGCRFYWGVVRKSHRRHCGSDFSDTVGSV